MSLLLCLGSPLWVELLTRSQLTHAPLSILVRRIRSATVNIQSREQPKPSTAMSREESLLQVGCVEVLGVPLAQEVPLTLIASLIPRFRALLTIPWASTAPGQLWRDSRRS